MSNDAPVASQARGRVKPLEGETGEAVGSDDDCPEQLRRIQKDLSDVKSELERTKQALEEAQHNSNQEDGGAGPDSDNFDYDASWAAGMAELRRYMYDRDEVVSNSEGAENALENMRQTMLRNVAAHGAEVKKLQETIAEQQEKIKSLEAELALQGQTPSEQEQSLKAQIQKLKGDLKDCQRKIATGGDADDGGDDGGGKDDNENPQESEADQIRRKDKEFEALQKVLTHTVYHRPDYDCDQRIKQLRERHEAEVKRCNARNDRKEEENQQLLCADYYVEDDEVTYCEDSDEDTDPEDDEVEALEKKLKKAEAKRLVAEKRLNRQKHAIAQLHKEKAELEKKEKDCVEQYAALKEKVLREEGAKEAEGAGGADPEAVQGQDTERADKLKKAENARQNAEYALEFTREELAKAQKDLKTQTKRREECDEKYKYLKEIDDRRTREEEEARKEARRQPPGAGPGPMIPVTPGTGAAGPSHDQDETLRPDDDVPMDDGPGPDPGPEYAAEIEALNHQIIQLEGRITAFEAAAGNDQEQIDALRSGSKCNKKLLTNIDNLRKELADLQKQLDECKLPSKLSPLVVIANINAGRNETWQERRRRLRLAAAANRRPRGTVPPRANQRLDPALQQQQEWAENGWWKGQDDIGPERKRRRTKK